MTENQANYICRRDMIFEVIFTMQNDQKLATLTQGTVCLIWGKIKNVS